MNRAILQLLARRMVRKNYLDVRYFTAHFLIMVPASTLWLISIDTSNLTAISIAAAIGVIAEAPFIFTFSFVFARLKRSSTKLFALFVTLVITSIVFVSVFYELSPQNYVAYYGGFFVGTLNQTLAVIYLYVVYAYVRESIYEYKKLAEGFSAVLNDLDEFENELNDRVLTEEKKLKSHGTAILVPTIKSITNQLSAKGVADSALSETIQDAIKNTIKPLGKDLRRNLDLEIPSQGSKDRKLSAWGSVPRRFSPRQTFNPLFSSWFLAPMLISSTFTVTKQAATLNSALVLFILWVMLEMAKFALPAKKWKAEFAVLMQQTCLWISMLLAGFVGYLLDPQTTYPFTFIAQIGILVSVVTVIYTYLSLIEFGMANAKKDIETFTSRLQLFKELSSQRLWIAKRNWSYLVHGKVQSHMLAAEIIAMGGTVDSSSLSELNRHLESVKQLLKNPPKPDANLLQETKDLELTWRGIAQLEFDFSEPALELLESNSSLRFAVNEIIREAVSNAVKHAHANMISILAGINNDALQIEVLNNGTKPDRNVIRSLGSQLLDELTSSWSLKFSKEHNKVRLLAQISLAKSTVN